MNLQELLNVLEAYGLVTVASPDARGIVQWYAHNDFGGAFQIRTDGKIGQQYPKNPYIQCTVCADRIFTQTEFLAWLKEFTL